MGETVEIVLGPPEWDTGWTWPLQGVQAFFEELWNNIRALWYGLWGFIRRTFDWVMGVDAWIGGKIYDAWEWILDKFRWVWNQLLTIYNWLSWRISDTAAMIYRWGIETRDVITGLAWNIYNWTTAWVSTIYNWLTSRIADLGSYLFWWLIWVKERIVEAVSWARAWLYDRLLEVWQAIYIHIHLAKDIVLAWITQARDWLAREIIDPWTDYVREIWDWIKTSLTNLWTRLREFLHGVWHLFLTNIAEPLYNAIVGAFTWVKDKFLEIVRSFLDTLLGLARGHSPILPEEAPAIFAAALGACALGVGTIALLQMGVEILHPVKAFLGHLSAIVYDFTNIGRVTGIFVGAFLVAMLKTPAEYYWNKIFRPFIPTWAELQGMARKHQISRERFFSAMAYHGFSDEWIRDIYYYMWADPRLYDILRLADVATPEGLPTEPELIERLGRMNISASDPDWWLKFKFMLAGYEDVDVAALTQVVHKRETLEERTRYVTQVRNMYHWGYWERDQALPALRYGGLGSTQIAYTLLAEDLWFQREVLEDRVMAWREAYRRDLLTLDQLRDNLLTVMPRRDRVQAVVELERVRKLPRPVVERPSPPKPRYETPAGKARVTAALTLYRGALISDETLRNRLSAEEMPAELVEATLALERARLAVKPLAAPPAEPAFYETAEGKLRVHTLRTLYRARLLSSRELTQGLEDLQMSPSLASAVLADEDAYIALHPPPPPPPAPPRYETDEGRAKLARDKEAFRTGQIDEEEFGRRLLELEMTPDMARWILDYEILRREARAPAPPAPPPAYYKTEEGKAELRLATERFRRGLLTPAEYYQTLLDLEMTESMATAIVEYEALRLAVPLVPTPPPAAPYYQTEEGRARLRLETERFRRAETTSGLFLAALVEMGMTEEQASFIVEYEELRLS